MTKECIVHLTQSFGCGGLERVIATVIQENRCPDVRHVVLSLHDDRSFQYALPEGVECLTVNKKEGLDLSAHFRVAGVLKSVNATVLHTYNFATLEYHVIAKLCGVKKHIHADHGLGGDHPEGKSRSHNIFRRGISFLLDHYVVVSQDLQRWVTECVKVNKSKVNVVLNGVPVPSRPPLKAKPPGELRLVIVGRLAPVKNHTRLLEALEQLQLSHPDLDVRCDVVGDGELRQMLEKTRDALPYPERVVFHGGQRDVSPFLAHADCLILSSDYEALPMTVLEAMAASRVVICPRVGGVADFLSDEQIFLVEGNSATALANAILMLARNDADYYQDKVFRAYDYALTHFSSQNMAAQYHKLYTD